MGVTGYSLPCRLHELQLLLQKAQIVSNRTRSALLFFPLASRKNLFQIRFLALGTLNMYTPRFSIDVIPR